MCVLHKLTKDSLTQQQLKELYGAEVRAYAKANNMLKPVAEHNRCWRLQYSDEVSFHLDTLPCVPEDEAVIKRLTAARVDWELVRRAVAITDKRHPHYRLISSVWLSSNPGGFAAWFEGRATLGRSRALTENLLRASVEGVPPYEWKTTLQQAIQLLKRHRDVMFRETPDLAPISMIITNLAANAYAGEADLADALRAIAEKMGSFVRATRPRVPNPADPAEDYADKWSKDPRLEKSFWDWHTAVRTDVAKLSAILSGGGLQDDIWDLFAVRLTEDEARSLGPRRATPMAVKATPSLIIPSAPKPWGSRA